MKARVFLQRFGLANHVLKRLNLLVLCLQGKVQLLVDKPLLSKLMLQFFDYDLNPPLGRYHWGAVGSSRVLVVLRALHASLYRGVARRVLIPAVSDAAELAEKRQRT